MAAVDLEVLYLPHYRSVQHQLARVALLLVNGAARAVPDHGLDALSTERMAALDGDDRLGEHSISAELRHHALFLGVWLWWAFVGKLPLLQRGSSSGSVALKGRARAVVCRLGAEEWRL